MVRIKCVLLALIFISFATAISGLVDMEGQETLNARMLQGSYTININATVVDNFGRSISYATVHIRDNSSTWQTNDTGICEIRGLADNVTEYRLYADKLDYLTDADLILPVVPDQWYDVTLEIIGGAVAGIVTSQSGGSIVGVNVSVVAWKLDYSVNYSTNASTVDGTYVISGIPGGAYYLNASAPGYGFSNKTVSVSPGDVTLVSHALAPLPGTISGFVFSADTLEPLGNASVSVALTGTTISIQTGEDGYYNISGVPEGTYVVVASKEGYLSAMNSSVVVAKDNWTENVNFSLKERPTSLHGTVKSGALLLRLVNVSVIGSGMFNLTDASGDYRIENITAGTYNVSASRDGYVTNVIEGVVIPVGGTVELDIDLVALPGAVLIGTVVDKDSPEKPLYNVAVTIFISETLQRTELTDPLGHFGFTELAAGNYTLQFEATGYKPLEIRNVAVKENETTNVTFKMEPLRTGFEGFIFGFDLAHSMMILALFITILILAVAVYLRYRTFQTPETAPAVYDHEDEIEEKKEGQEATEEDKKREEEVL